MKPSTDRPIPLADHLESSLFSGRFREFRFEPLNETYLYNVVRKFFELRVVGFPVGEVGRKAFLDLLGFKKKLGGFSRLTVHGGAAS